MFNTKIFEIFQDFIPKKRIVRRKLPWVTHELSSLKKLRNNFNKKYKRSNRLIFLLKYKQLSREFNSLNKRLHKTYIASIESKIKRNPKTFWNYINSFKKCQDVPSTMVLDNHEASTPVDIANLFAKFFSSNFSFNNNALVGNSLSADTPYSLGFGRLVLTDSELISAILNLKPSSKIDQDGLSVDLLQKCHTSLIKPILFIFNLSLEQGVFIDDWKHSTVTPIFKKGHKNRIENYRPIAKLSTMSKLFEAVLKDHIFFFIKNSISQKQHGFFPDRSTLTNLAIFSNYCISSFQQGFQVDTIYTDFSKAFDRVSHSILLNKLAKLGFHTNMLVWFASYLSNRLYSVVIDNVVSTPFIAHSGVPQGSILGPILFLAFINDITDVIVNSECLLFADDMKIYLKVESDNDMTNLQMDLDRISNWCDLNLLPLNIDKCLMLTYSKSSQQVFNSYKINNVVLPRVTEIKDLGVTFDSRFSFSSHINSILPKAYSMLAFIRRRCYNFIDPYTLLTLYYSLVRSRLEYACFIWNPFYTRHVKRLERVQKCFLKFALRHLNFSGPMPSYEARSLLLHLKSLEDRRNILSISFVVEIINGRVDCDYLLKLIDFKIPNKFLRHTEVFYIPTHRSNYAMNSPLLRYLKLLNSILHSHDIDIFSNKSHVQNKLRNVNFSNVIFPII